MGANDCGLVTLKRRAPRRIIAPPSGPLISTETRGCLPKDYGADCVPTQTTNEDLRESDAIAMSSPIQLENAYSLAYSIVRNHEDAQELVDRYVDRWLSTPEAIEPSRPELIWFMRHRVRDLWRSRTRRAAPVSFDASRRDVTADVAESGGAGEPSWISETGGDSLNQDCIAAGDIAAQREVAAQVRSIAEELPERQRHAVIEHIFGGVPVATIASEGGWPTRSVQRWIQLGRETVAMRTKEQLGVAALPSVAAVFVAASMPGGLKWLGPIRQPSVGGTVGVGVKASGLAGAFSPWFLLGACILGITAVRFVMSAWDGRSVPAGIVGAALLDGSVRNVSVALVEDNAVALDAVAPLQREEVSADSEVVDASDAAAVAISSAVSTVTKQSEIVFELSQDGKPVVDCSVNVKWHDREAQRARVGRAPKCEVEMVDPGVYSIVSEDVGEEVQVFIGHPKDGRTSFLAIRTFDEQPQYINVEFSLVARGFKVSKTHFDSGLKTATTPARTCFFVAPAGPTGVWILSQPRDDIRETQVGTVAISHRFHRKSVFSRLPFNGEVHFEAAAVGAGQVTQFVVGMTPDAWTQFEAVEIPFSAGPPADTD